MSAPTVPLGPGAGSRSVAAPPPAPPAPIPWFGLLAVLLGTFISTLTGRLSVFGLADIRAAVHAGFDEGAWITTAQTVAQMLVAPVAIWAGTAYGARRVLLAAATGFAVVSLLEPFSTNLAMLLAFQFAAGLTSGCFIPLTLSFILRNTPPKVWAWGVALYALNLELSLNISASLEGWYVDHLSWAWVFWQNVPLALGMALCLRFGVAPDPPNPKRPPSDVYGLAAGGIGLALIYAALDQGNRLDWLNSGVVVGLLAAGGVVLAGFFVHEARSPHPLVDLKAAFAPPLPFLLLLISFLRLTILATAYLIPLYLGAVRGFRALEVGQTLVWVAAPQLIFCPLAALMLRRSDPRLVACIGFIFVSISCLSVAWGLTPLWGSDQFLPSAMLQALGQSFALSGVLFYAVLHLRPEAAITFGAAVQTARLMGGEIGLAFTTTFVRVQGQAASNLIGQHVRAGDPAVLDRLRAYAAVAGRTAGPAASAPTADAILASVVRSAATTQSVIDGFAVIGALTAFTLILVIGNRQAPLGPASHLPLFAPRKAGGT
jgi:DHA2 family multidrug resistance protein